MPDVGDALDVLQDVLGLVGQQLQLVDVRAEDLEGVVTLDPGEGLQHVVADVLREVPVTPGIVALQVGVHRTDDFRFVRAALGPKIHRRQPVASITLGQSSWRRSGTKYSPL